MPTRYDVTDESQFETGVAAATTAIRSGQLVVLPTDTVYGLAADAFDPVAVARLLRAKGRGRAMPPPVLIAAPATLDALGTGIRPWVRTLVQEFWPGPLTLIVHQQSSLQWDLGETRGTVAVRMPEDPVALELLTRTGPLAVSSANLTGRPAAIAASAAEEMLGDRVEVILDNGPSAGGVASTILDCTGDQPRVMRSGAIGVDRIREVLTPLDIAVEDLEDPHVSDAPADGEGPAPGA